MEYYVLPAGSTEVDVGIHNRKCKVVDADLPRLAKAEYLRRYGKRFKISSADELEVRYASGAREGKLVVSQPARSGVTTYDDSKFVRTALVCVPGVGGSIDVVDGKGERLCQIILHHLPGDVDHLIVDIDDVDDRFTARKSVVFPVKGHAGVHTKAGSLVSADFRKEK